MGFIKTLLLKRIGTEKTWAKLTKIASFVFSITGMLIFLIGLIRLLNMDISPEELNSWFKTLFLLLIGLVIVGTFFDLYSEIIKIKIEIKNLKDKIKE